MRLGEPVDFTVGSSTLEESEAAAVGARAASPSAVLDRSVSRLKALGVAIRGTGGLDETGPSGRDKEYFLRAAGRF